MRVALQLLSFEEESLWETMDEWAEQETGDHSVTYQACVTPRQELRMQSVRGEMVEHAQDHPEFEYIQVSSGKLSARNEAHDLAVEEGYDVIITTDADAPPLHDRTLVELLQPYSEPDVVATNSTPVAQGIVGQIVNVAAGIEDLVRPHMHGQLSSFTTEAWTQCGPFDESVDQTNIHEVRAEEEHGFYRNLREYGRIVSCPDALVLNDTRRVLCRLESVRPGNARYEFCTERTETFHPLNRR